MTIVLKYGNTELNIFGDYNINKSSQDMTYSDINCDFTGHTKEELPEKYQEVKIVEKNGNNYGNILYMGYVESYSFGEMRETDIETDLRISLYSPKKMSTLRTTIAKGTFNLKELIADKILTPLIDDGFILKTLNISNNNVTVNFTMETIEYCMNNLSNKYNFWWYIDENKNIYVEDISIMLSKKPQYIYDNNNIIPYLLYIKPTITSGGYANVVNFKNVRIYEYSNLEMNGTTINSSYNPLINNQITTTIKKDGQIDFNYPCDITKDNILKSGISIGKTEYSYLYGLHIKGKYNDNSTFEFYIRYNKNTNQLETTSNIGFEGNEQDSEKEFLLIRDAFFKNLIIGFRYNNENKTLKSFELLQSDSALIWNINRMYNDNAIYEKKGVISDTGIVETTIDMNGSWKTLQELREIGSSYINKNSLSFDGEIELKVDTYCDIKIGDIIKINKMFFNDSYIVTKIQTNMMYNEKQWFITCKNANMLDNFIDVFRTENEQENDDKAYKISIVHYVEEKINEVFEVIK
nr:MAG TPA: hypothetical protein [Caudoviricetes sp.]